MSPTPEIFAPASDQPVRITVPGSGYELREELDRKTFETLDWLVSGVNAGKVTEAEFSVAIDAIFMALSGLVDSPFIEIVTEAQKQCHAGYRRVERFFHHEDKAEIIKLSRLPGEPATSLFKLVMGQSTAGKRFEFDTSKEALEWVNKTANGLTEKGWIEL